MVFQTDYLPVVGDFDGDRLVTAADIDLLSTAVRSPEFNTLYDLTGDGTLSDEDRIALVEEHRSTYFGDSNLDGVFDTSDLVTVFQAGQFEDNIVGNSTWATGDWDGSGDFVSIQVNLCSHSLEADSSKVSVVTWQPSRSHRLYPY